MLRRAANALLFAPLIVTNGCDRKQAAVAASTLEPRPTSASVSSSATPSLPPGEGSFAIRATIEGKPIAFGFGGAHASSDGLLIVLSDRPIPCSVTRQPATHQLEMSIPKGPGGSFFVGQRTGVDVSLFFDQRQMGALGGAGVVQLAPFDVKVGAHIRGTLEYRSTRHDSSNGPRKSEARGAFVIEMCDGEAAFEDHPSLPERALEELAGELGGRPFTYAKGLAWVRRDHDQEMDVLDRIELFASADVTCSAPVDRKRRHVSLQYILGANSRDRLFGKPQPARPAWHEPGATTALTWFGGTAGDRGAWVQLDALSFEEGAVLHGSAAAASGRDADPSARGRFSGRFEAVVCRTGD